MSVHSSQKKKRRDPKLKFKTMASHNEFLSRITKTLYYAKLPITERLSLPVTELAAELYSEVKSGRSLERLRLEEAAEIGRNACVSPCSLVLAMLYLERLKTCNPSYVDQVAPSDLFLISMMVASKFLNDDGEEDEVLNSEWASSVGIGLKDINRLEKEFLNAINWEVFVKEKSFWNQLRLLERKIALKEGKRRGWFSYTELENLLDIFDTVSLIHALMTVSAVCLASYTAGILTIVGSTMLVNQIPTAYTISRSVMPHFMPAFTYSHQVNQLIDETSSQEVLKAIAVEPCPTKNETVSKEFLDDDKNWSLILFNWIRHSVSNNSEDSTLNFKLDSSLFSNRGTSSFSSVANYVDYFTQNTNLPIKLSASH